MGISTHLGPWLLGTNRYNSGNTASTTRNTGATIVAQTKAIGFADTTGNAFALPAGALITGISFLTTTAFSGATTVTLKIGATDITGALTVTTAGKADFTAATTADAAALWANIGNTDKFVEFAVGGAPTAGAGQIVIQYVVRNADGSMYNSPTQD